MFQRRQHSADATKERRGSGPALRVPTSEIVAALLRDVPGDEVTLAWIVGQLRDRSFGIVMLLIALVGIVPGVGTVAAFLLALPAIQMILARPAPVLPRFIAERRLSTARIARLVMRLVPVLRWLERAVRPRWTTPFETTKRVLGVVMLLLSATILTPIPFGHIMPILVIMLLAFAFLEGDGLLLCLALAGALASIAITVASLWGTIEAGLLL
jgi:hypothetical protein